MKINVHVAVACIFTAILSVVILYILEQNYFLCCNWNEIIKNIAIGLFSGAIVSIIISITNYYGERSMVLEKIEKNLKLVYKCENIIIKTIEEQLMSAHYDKSYIYAAKNIHDKSDLIMNCFENMNLDRFYLFCKCGKLYKIYKEIMGLKDVYLAIKNECINIEIVLNNYEIMLIQKYSISCLDDFFKKIRDRYFTLMKYVEQQNRNVENILFNLYQLRYNEDEWYQVKKDLYDQINFVVNMYQNNNK